MLWDAIFLSIFEIYASSESRKRFLMDFFDLLFLKSVGELSETGNILQVGVLSRGQHNSGDRNIERINEL